MMIHIGAPSGFRVEGWSILGLSKPTLPQQKKKTVSHRYKKRPIRQKVSRIPNIDPYWVSDIFRAE